MLAIFKRDFKSYMHSFIGPLFIGVVVALFSLFFIMFNLLGLSNNINGALYNLGYWGLMFTIPILCMRAFSEERRSKTDQMILTAPVSVYSIVIGKFLAISTVFAIPTALFCIVPVVLTKFGTIPFIWNYTSLLGFFLYGIMLIAICLFISNLSDNPLICAVISIITIVICNLSVNFYDKSNSQVLKTILASTIDFSTRMANMMTGNCDITSVVYFITVTILFLFLTVQIIQKRRYSVSKKNFSISAYSTVSIIVMISVVIAANMAALQIPDTFREIDVTAQNIYSLSDATKNVVTGINDDVTLYFFAKEDDNNNSTKDQGIEKVLKHYTALNDHIKLEYIDPVINPQLAKKYTDSDINYSSVIVVNENTGRSRVVNYNDMYETSVNYQTYQQTVTGYDTEGEITYALQYVCLPEDKLMKAYVVTGHKEGNFSDSFNDVISKDNMDITEISLLTTTEIPSDCDLLILNSPAVDYNEQEADAVIKYLDNGGNVLITTYYQTNGSLDNFGKILDYYGVKVEPGVLMENDSNRYIASQTPYYLLPVVGNDDITNGVNSETTGAVFTPLSQPLSYTEKDGVTVTELLTTSDSAYIQYLSANAEDNLQMSNAGKWDIGLKAVKTLDSGSSTAVIYSSADMFTDQADQMVHGNNLILFGNTLKSLVSFDVELVTIPSKAADSPITMAGQTAIFFMLIMLLTVVLIFASGLGVWISRRKR
ncbi:Gldg family protein [Butyrivibrio sp. AE3004]|uniref:Gldg family protein n=1 Tax=Butyrivibrio sp. AE3004 TaxID=1506994 RepID=UPI0004946C3E|nr:Gldg family protein [Butyrivibrio sp. AE3004]